MRHFHSIAFISCILCIFSSQAIYAQCTGCTTTISSSSSANVSLGSNTQKLCITGGTYTGAVTLQNGADLCIAAGATFTPSSLTINNTATTITNNGTFTIGSFSLSGTLINNGDFTVNGSLTITSSGSIVSQGSSFSVTGSMTVQSDVSIVGNASVGGSLLITGSGDLTLQDGELTVGGAFENQGTVSAAGASSCGQINVAGASKNLGQFGTDDSNIDICDSSGGADDGFDDNQRPLGTNVTNCTCAGTLPVELISFSGDLLTTAIQLKWVTAQEQNSSHFEVERSLDGKEFNYIGQHTASQHSGHLINYQFQDAELQAHSPIIYYRLKQVDLDDTYTYSKVIAVVLDEVLTIPQFQYHPQSQVLSVSNIEQEIPVQFVVYRTDGSLVEQQELTTSKEITFVQHKSGVYIIHYLYGKHQGVWRFFKN